MKQNLKDYMLSQLEKLLAIPSPTGYTKEVSEYLMAELTSMGYAPYSLNKGGVICALNEGENALMLAAHVDTLGAISIKSILKPQHSFFLTSSAYSRAIPVCKTIIL